MNNSFRKVTKNGFPLPIRNVFGCVIYPALVLLIIGTAGYFYFQQANFKSALDCTKRWAQLNDFPASASNVTVETKGSMFSRQFIVEFDAPIPDIKKWLSDSPGTQSVTPTMNGDTHHYEIEPGDGAINASLELDENSGHVTINASWS